MSIGAKKAEPTKHELALRQVSLESARLSRDTLRPLEDKLIERSDSTEGDKTRARGLASTDVAAAMGGRDQALVGALGNTSSKSKMARAGLSDALGTAIGRSTGDAEAALKSKDEGAKFNIAAAARSQQGVEMDTLSTAVGRASQNSIASLDRAMDRNQFLVNSVGQGMGAAMERGNQLDEIAAYNKAHPDAQVKTTGSRGLDMATAGFNPGKYNSFYEMQRLNALMGKG